MVNFTISIPTDEGFIGRKCNNLDCQRYFRVYADSLKHQMFCPYCGVQYPSNELWTDDQYKYIRAAAEEKVREVIHDEFDEMLRRLARKSSRNKHFRMTYRPKPYRPKLISPQYHEPQVDSELTCPECNFRFQVHGIFGYCPGCRSENLRIYDANLEIIKQEVLVSPNPERALRHAYSDLVSTFESFCKRKALLLAPKEGEFVHFQMLFDTRKFFKKHLAVDIFDGLDHNDLLSLRRAFQKRHTYEHYEGIINDKYIRKIPEDSALRGTKAELSLEEFVQASTALRRALDNLALALETRKYR